MNCRLTHSNLQRGFLYIPQKHSHLFPTGNGTVAIKALLGDSGYTKELTFKPRRLRLFGLTKWYRESGAEIGDVVSIDVLGSGKYRLKLERSSSPLVASGGTKSKRLVDVFGSTKENDMYPHVIAALKKYLLGKETHLEITATGARLSSKIEEVLDEKAFFFIKTERASPDIMGYVIEDTSLAGFGILAWEERNRVVVEVKNEPVSVEDFYQAKRYGEVFDAKYAFLISNERIPEVVKRFLAARPAVLSYNYSGGIRPIIFGEIDLKTDGLRFERFKY